MADEPQKTAPGGHGEPLKAAIAHISATARIDGAFAHMAVTPTVSAVSSKPYAHHGDLWPRMVDAVRDAVREVMEEQKGERIATAIGATLRNHRG